MLARGYHRSGQNSDRAGEARLSSVARCTQPSFRLGDLLAAKPLLAGRTQKSEPFGS
jgi:hypothetical protein